MNDEICSAHVCSAERQGQIVFRDRQHLTASFAGSLAPMLEKEMNKAYPISIEPKLSDPSVRN
jgi:hypothetical protein